MHKFLIETLERVTIADFLNFAHLAKKTSIHKAVTQSLIKHANELLFLILISSSPSAQRCGNGTKFGETIILRNIN